MRATYILDTSALISDPQAYKSFKHSDILIPIAVLSELDKLKKQPGEAGKNARVANKLLDELSNLGDIGVGILIDNDILVKIDTTYYDLNNPMFAGFGDPNYGDTQILACAYAALKAHPFSDVTMVSNDLNLRIKARARGLSAEGHEKDGSSINELYSGVQTIINEDAGYMLQQNGNIDPSQYGLELHPNECVLFQNDIGDGIAMGRKVASDRIKLLRRFSPWGISSRNMARAFAIDMLMDKSIDLVTLTGRAGTGKSLIVLASALELVLNRREYDKLIIYKPIVPVGNDIGFLPGLREEKLAPYFQSILDSFELLFSSKSGDWKKNLEMYKNRGSIEMEALTFIRGRSLPNAIIFLDEAQNMTKEEIKTLLTRAGEGTKIVLVGDLDQIDKRDLDANNNGLSYVIEKFKSSSLSGNILLDKGERSRLATMASEIL